MSLSQTEVLNSVIFTGQERFLVSVLVAAELIQSEKELRYLS